ncbi:MAG: hypothetical protein HC878_20560 [Leptolyngbyaceae cyanobacterium SL_5_14]|nr:hypothetical protein [Leptolyngbyaceae cyanobacterium SL_5_14]
MSELDLPEIFNQGYETESKGLLIDQYKMYVEMHDRISARRNQANSFFISLLSGLLAIFSISSRQGQNLVPPFSGLVVGFLGTVLCILWNFNISAYRRLVERKIQVILEMEKYLPFYCYNRESVLRQKDLAGKAYLRPTKIEQFTSVIFSIVYLSLMIYSLFNLN